jgi:hypothetical protein
VEALSAPAPEPMLHVTPALEESLETAAVKDWTPLPLSDAVVGLTLTLMEGGGFELDPPPFAQPARRTRAVSPEKPIASRETTRDFIRMTLSDPNSDSCQTLAAF